MRSRQRVLALACTAALALQFGLPAVAVESGAQTYRAAPVAAGAVGAEEDSARTIQSLNGAWSYRWMGADQTDLSKEEVTGWDNVTVPHCWNAGDGADGGNNYKRGIGWYSRTVEITADQLAGRVFFECYGASQQADVYVNGTHVGNHKGGYTAFRYDITEQLKEGPNRIDVKVDNTNGGKTNTIIAPIVGDFTVFGGMYRDVNLVFTQPVHVDAIGEVNPDGNFDTAPGTGLYLATPNVSSASATLDISAKIVNDGAEEKQVTVTAVLKEQDASQFDWDLNGAITTPLAFDPADMGNGTEVETVTQTMTIPGKGAQDFEQTITVTDPHLWNGVTDPFRYEVELEVEVDGQVVDTVSDYVGFRSFEVTDEGGFFLNGEPYLLRGVSRHQDREDKGYAISKADHEQDFGLIYEIGATSVRLAHYPQDPYIYDLCDRYGIVVWAEIPFIGGHNDAGHDDADEIMRQTTKQQLRELILQQFNRPSICFWGLENEVGHQATATKAKAWIADMNEMAHELDPSRLTTMATNNDQAYGWASDLIAWNTYPGWYGGNLNGLGSTMDGKRNNGDKRPVGISEYGAGGNPYQHEFNTSTSIGNAGGQWHPEEYQSDSHEANIRDINKRPWLWCTYVWNMFDFGSDSRNEGDNPGINDKGLISYDRTLKKDSFYLYKANWNQLDRFVHITSQRWDPREETPIPEVKVYSNCDTVTLTVNDKDLGEGVDEGNGVFTWSEVELANVGENTVTATGTKDGKTYTDTCVWNRQKSTSTDLRSDVLAVNDTDKTIGLAGQYTVAELADVLFGVNNAIYKVYESDGQTPAEGTALVIPGMKVVVTAEDGETTATYTFVSMNLSYGKKVTASSVQNGNDKEHAVDFNSSTRWAANKSFNDGGDQWITVDLGETYHLTSLDITWYNNTSSKRAYRYEVQVSDDNKDFTTVVDRSDNTQQDTVHDSLGDAQGRYVRILVKGCTAGGTYSASIYEIAVNGWALSSEKFIVDDADRLITVPAESFTGALYPDDLLAGIEVSGNCMAKMDDMSNYYIVDGDGLLIQVDDGTCIRYAIDMPSGDEPVYGIVSTNKPVTFSAQEGISSSGESTIAANINDGNDATRWSAPQYKEKDPDTGLGIPGSGTVNGGTRYFPEWVTIDLGRLYDIKELDVLFYKHGQNDRSYQYELLVSETGAEDSFRQVVDATENADKSGDFSHQVEVRGRYVRINVTGCSRGESWATASVHELEVLGKAVSGGELAESVTFDQKSISMRVNDQKIPAYTISPEGLDDVSVTLTSDAPDVVRVDGEKLIALQEGNAEITISVDGRPDLTDTMTVTVSGVGPISVGKPITFSAEEGTASGTSGGGSTVAANINDGDMTTRWAAPQYKDKDPETGLGIPSSGTTSSGYRYFPEWVTIDLGAVYDVSKLEVLFYKHGENNRAYQYEILVSVTGAEDSFRQIVDAKNNADLGGDYTHELDDAVRARYVKLNVTGCSLDENWAGASVYEFSVYGDLATVQEHTVTVDVQGQGKASAQPEQAAAGEKVALTATPDKGWHFVKWESDDVEVAEDGTFTMPDKDVAVTAVFEQDVTKVESITVSASTDIITNQDDPTLQMVAAVLPEDATDKTVTWSVETVEVKTEEPVETEEPTTEEETQVEAETVETEQPTETEAVALIELVPAEVSEPVEAADTVLATIDPKTGLLTALAEGTVKVTATANDGSEVFGTKEITIDFDAEPTETYAITVDTQGEGTASADLKEAAEGVLVTLMQSAANGWHFVGWQSADVSIENDQFLMPDHTVTITAMFEKDKTISVTGVTLDRDSLRLEEGDTYTLTATVEPSDATNKTVTWSSDDTDVATVDQNGKIRAKGPGTAVITVTTEDGKFTATCKVTVYAYDGGSSSGGSSSRPEPRYDVEMDVTGGSVKLSNTRPKAGDRVTVTLRPDAGMELERIEVITEDGDTVKLTKVDEDEYTFRQPSEDVTIRVVFKAVETEPEVEFGDVKDSDWFAAAVEYVVEKGLMQGVGADLFQPQGLTDRAMIVTILYRLEGEPTVTGGQSFPDVAPDTWYAEAVRWASSEGIVDGYADGTFGPTDPVTREQLAAILYRYAGKPTVEGESKTFADSDQISSWAVEAMDWAVKSGVLSGKGGNLLDSTGTATRAEVAQILMNFCENVK